MDPKTRVLALLSIRLKYHSYAMIINISQVSGDK
jgi:hypothetical protein